MELPKGITEKDLICLIDNLVSHQKKSSNKDEEFGGKSRKAEILTEWVFNHKDNPLNIFQK